MRWDRHRSLLARWLPRCLLEANTPCRRNHHTPCQRRGSTQCHHNPNHRNHSPLRRYTSIRAQGRVLEITGSSPDLRWCISNLPSLCLRRLCPAQWDPANTAPLPETEVPRPQTHHRHRITRLHGPEPIQSTKWTLFHPHWHASRVTLGLTRRRSNATRSRLF